MNKLVNKNYLKVLRYLNQNEIFYGHTDSYNALIPCESTIIRENDLESLYKDFDNIKKFFCNWNNLYLESITRKDLFWIKDFIELGLSDDQKKANQLISKNQLQPKVARIDYIKIGKERKVSEIQWKSGGYGLFAGIQDAFLELGLAANESRTPILSREISRLLNVVITERPGVVVGCFRRPWIKSEEYLSKKLRRFGIEYIPLRINELKDSIQFKNGYFYYCNGSSKKKITLLYGLGFWTAFENNIIDLAESCIENRIWIETPLNVVYRQKWGMAIPFLDLDKGNEFSDIRKIFPETALINPKSFTIFPMKVGSSQLGNLSKISLDKVIDFSARVRKKYVFKCGGGLTYNSKGRGVIRLTGTKRQDKIKLEFIKKRVLQYGEPWIIQEYISSNYSIPCMNPIEIEYYEVIKSMHARFLLFVNFYKENLLMGGIANYSKHWKVNGSSNLKDTNSASAFNDIRIQK